MCSPASSKILYRNPRFLRLAFLQLHHQQQSGVFCDVLLQAEGEAVPAHCCILSACSPFFTERLEQERPAQGRKVVLELGGLKIRTLRKLVDFLYTSEMEASWEEAQDVLSAARQLRVSELESLQLEGGKLVKAPQGRRLNRECLQPSNTPISARVVPPGHRARTPLPISQPPCPGAARPMNLGREEGPQEGSAQPSAVGSLLLPRKPRACPAPQEKGTCLAGRAQKSGAEQLGPAAPSPPGPHPSTDQRLLPRKIRISRSKPPPGGGTSKPPSSLSGSSSVPTAPGRRLWRQRMNREAAGDKKPDSTDPLQSTPSPSVLGKPVGTKKRSPEVKVPTPDSAEEGQVGRVKLRKVVNGSCWEVVQEPPPPPPLRNPAESPQTPEPGNPGGSSRALEPRGLQDPSGAQLSPVSKQEVSSARIELYQDSPEGPGVLDVMLATGHSPDQPGVRRAFGSSPELLGKEPMLSSDPGKPCAFRGTLHGQHCDGVSSSMATSELEDILDLVLCGSDIGPPVRSPQSPRGEGCRTPSYHLAEAGESWMAEEEWCLPDLELWSRELVGLEKEPDGENEEPAGPLSALVMPAMVREGKVLPVGGSWTPGLEIPNSHPPDGGGDRLHTSSPGNPSMPCSSWTVGGLDVCLAEHEEPHGAPGTGPGPLTASSEDEIDVVDWTAEAGLVPTGVPSVWPDPSSESETEVDILM